MAKRPSSSEKPFEIQLGDLRLLSCSCVNHELEVRPSKVDQNITISSSKHERSVILKIVIALRAQTADAREAIRVDAAYGLVYLFSQPLDQVTEEQANSFGQLYGMAHLWPYWRELVQSLTSRMGLPPLRLPLLNVQKFQSPSLPTADGGSALIKKKSVKKRRARN